MTCEGCVKDISASLYKLDGISKVEANLADQLVRIEGTGRLFFNTSVLVWFGLFSSWYTLLLKMCLDRNLDVYCM